MCHSIRLVFLIISISILGIYASSKESKNTDSSYKIEGKVIVPETANKDWIASTKVLADGGDYIGFLRSDGSFVISNVPSGSYMVEIANYKYMFEPQRVDISAKGTVRSRKVNNLQPGAVTLLSYPMRFRSRGLAKYFEIREQWRITDFLFNPMVLMMVLPLLLIMIMPKMMNTQDPEVQKEMQNMNPFNNKSQMPDISEMFTSIFGGGATKKTAKSKLVKRK